ncbi:MAG: RHS repeat-associated core domain-containing protein [Methanobacteriota archaeon]|nr:MAG: RHS repeat-associated core domain-containing protein [Euryarchaeota archaeon]
MSVVVEGGQTYVPHKFFYLKDHLGSTRAVVDINGEVKESYDYYPFGLHMPGKVYLAGPAVTKNLFTGIPTKAETSLFLNRDEIFQDFKERDAETHWDYFGARYYSPALGRWLAVDPLAEKYPGWSSYAYAYDNPVNFFDPDGKEGLGAAIRQDQRVKRYLNGEITREQYLAETNAEGQGALLALSLLSFGTIADGIIGTVQDIATGNLGLSSLLNFLPGDELIDIGRNVSKTAESLQKIAKAASEVVGPGKGAVHGTKIHTKFAEQVKKTMAGLKPEVSYKGGKVVERGTKGSIRVDVVKGNPKKPTAIFDLKTGKAKLTKRRIKQIRKHLPEGYKDIPIEEIRNQ